MHTRINLSKDKIPHEFILILPSQTCSLCSGSLLSVSITLLNLYVFLNLWTFKIFSCSCPILYGYDGWIYLLLFSFWLSHFLNYFVFISNYFLSSVSLFLSFLFLFYYFILHIIFLMSFISLEIIGYSFNLFFEYFFWNDLTAYGGCYSVLCSSFFLKKSKNDVTLIFIFFLLMWNYFFQTFALKWHASQKSQFFIGLSLLVLGNVKEQGCLLWDMSPFCSATFLSFIFCPRPI